MTTSPVSAWRSGRHGRHALAHARGDAALEGEHLAAVHRGLGDRAQLLVGRHDEGFVPRTDLGVRIPDELFEHVLPLAGKGYRVRGEDNPEVRNGERFPKPTGARDLQREPAAV